MILGREDKGSQQWPTGERKKIEGHSGIFTHNIVYPDVLQWHHSRQPQEGPTGNCLFLWHIWLQSLNGCLLLFWCWIVCRFAAFLLLYAVLRLSITCDLSLLMLSLKWNPNTFGFFWKPLKIINHDLKGKIFWIFLAIKRSNQSQRVEKSPRPRVLIFDFASYVTSGNHLHSNDGFTLRNSAYQGRILILIPHH